MLLCIHKKKPEPVTHAQALPVKLSLT